jgi:hypothetical protein
MDNENLRYFDQAEAVSFYRNHLCKIFSDMHEEIGGRKVRRFGEILIQYNELDFYLSPFTSYPVHDPLQLLFTHPFNRLYEDVYLLEKSDLEIFKKRAYLVFVNFADLIYVALENHLCAPMNLEMFVRELALLWNITEYQIDKCAMNLEHLYSKGEGSGKYHLLSKGLLIKIEDLETGEKLLCESEYWELSRGDGPLTYFDKPLDYLIPCSAPDRFGVERGAISIKDIIHAIYHKLKMKDRRHMKFRREFSII